MSLPDETSSVSRRHFLAVATSTVAATSTAIGLDPRPLLAQSQSNPVRYVVLIDVTMDPPSYSVSPYQKDAKNLQVNVGDEVNWQVKSKGPHPQHSAKILFATTTPFVDQNGKDIHKFKWTEKEDAHGGYGAAKAHYKGDHKYSVGVFDAVAQEVYVDDPKVVVGGGFIDAAADIKQAEGELTAAKEKLNSAENNLREALKKLNR